MADREPRAGRGGTEITCEIAVSDVRRGASGGTVTGVRLEVVYRAGGRSFARAGGGARFLGADAYAALRDGKFVGRLPPTTSEGRPDPATLALSHQRDLLVVRRAGALTVEPADPHHPFFFDHATDHVPGMVLLEAARQAAADNSGGALLRPTAGRLVAKKFTEFFPAARVEPVTHHLTCVFRIRQGSACTAYGVLGYGRHAL
jgi:hypothetical protein